MPGLGLLAAYRPEEVEDAGPAARFLRELWRGGSSPLAVDIGPLGEDGVHQLVADRALAAVLSDWTDRTPLVIGEVLQCLAQQGAVYRDARGRWRPANAEAITFAEAAAREGQARLVLDRTRRLTRPQATLLSLLALAGREVPPAVLGRAVGVLPRQILDDLQVLGHLGLARLAEHGWATRHDFVAETLAADQSREERGRLHAMLADALGPDAADEAEVAGHLAAAGDAEAAATVFARAASEHLQRFADQEAWALAERGLSLTTRPETRALLLEARAEARGRRGELAGARTDLREALVNQRDHVVRARILTRTAALALGADDLQRGSDQAELALVEAGDDPAQRAAALVVCAVADMNLRREDRATDRYGEASRIFERLSDTRGLAEVVGAQAMSAFMAGDLRRAADEFQRAARLLEDTGDLLSALTPWSTRGHALCFLGNPEAALAAADASLEMARTLGSPDGQAMVLAHRAEALCGLGRVDEALADAAEGVRLAEDAGHRAWTSLALRARGIAQCAAGDLPGAEESFRAALRVSPVPTLVGWASARLAMVLVAGGQLEKATHHVQVALADTPPVVHYEARLAEAELAAARHDPDAATAARDALGLARAGGHLASVPRLEELVAGDPAS